MEFDHPDSIAGLFDDPDATATTLIRAQQLRLHDKDSQLQQQQQQQQQQHHQQQRIGKLGREQEQRDQGRTNILARESKLTSFSKEKMKEKDALEERRHQYGDEEEDEDEEKKSREEEEEEEEEDGIMVRSVATKPIWNGLEFIQVSVRVDETYFLLLSESLCRQQGYRKRKSV